MSSGNIITIILLILGVLAVYSFVVTEGYCNCTGMGWKTPNPTYFVYRPTGDVSQYGSDYATISSEPPILPMQDLGWQTGMPYDYFVNHMKNNDWAAGSDPKPCSTSVPFLSLSQLNPNVSNVTPVLDVPGSSCGSNANNMVTITPYAKGLNFINGPSGYPNMLSDGTPQREGPAGSFTSPGNGCPSANAYNLGVGVL